MRVNKYLIFIFIVGFYFLYGITQMLLNVSKYNFGDYIVLIGFLVILGLILYFLIKKYKTDTSKLFSWRDFGKSFVKCEGSILHFLKRDKNGVHENTDGHPNAGLSGKKTGSLYLVLGAIIFFVFAILCVIKYGAPDVSAFSTASKSISIEQSKNAENIFRDIGVDKFTEVRYDEMLSYDGLIGFRVKYGELNLIAYFKDGSLSQIKFADNFLYDDGKIMGTVKDYTMTVSEQTDLQLKCQEGVKAILKAPSTATFPSILEWRFGKDKERIIVQSYVDAQNSFGAKLRSQFQFIFSSDGNTVKSFIFDDKEYIK
jgi:hypothetical protein